MGTVYCDLKDILRTDRWFVDTLSGLAHIVLLSGAGVSPVLQVKKSSPFQYSGWLNLSSLI